MLKIQIKKFNLICLIIIGMIGMVNTVFAQNASEDSESGTAVTTWILSDFDDHTKIPDINIYNGGRHDVTWNVVGSRYITRTDELRYPLTGTMRGAPAIIQSDYRDREIKYPGAARIFVIRAAFNTKDYNYLDIIPVDSKNYLYLDKEGDPMPGIYFHERLHQIGLYVLGIKRDYYLSAIFETGNGESFEVSLGHLNYKGWKALVASVPVDHFISDQAYINSSYLLKLAKFRLETGAHERVDDFVVYIDQVFYTLTMINDDYYDGFELLLPKFKDNKEGNNIEWIEKTSTNN